MRVFNHRPDLDSFEVTPEFLEVARDLGLEEWHAAVFIGRSFAMDNDFGEHWFDNWDARDTKRETAERQGVDADQLLLIDPARFCHGRNGPCHPAPLRALFWRDVLLSLDLSPELLFAEALHRHAQLESLIAAGRSDLEPERIPDLEVRIARWSARLR